MRSRDPLKGGMEGKRRENITWPSELCVVISGVELD